jgi:hypothetical protein
MMGIPWSKQAADKQHPPPTQVRAAGTTRLRRTSSYIEDTASLPMRWRGHVDMRRDRDALRSAVVHLVVCGERPAHAKAAGCTQLGARWTREIVLW